MRQIILLLALIFLLPSVFAATTVLEPSSVYETNSVVFNTSVNNFLGQGVVTDVLLGTGSLQVDSVQEFSGWDNNFTAHEIHWFDGTIENNIANALFLFTSTLPKVDSDQQVVLTGKLTYDDSSKEDFTLLLSVLNDETPPEISRYSPRDYARAGITDQEVAVNAVDPETGIDEVTYEYGPCDGNKTKVTLACSGNSCTGTADFSDFDEGDKACFEITATNNAGESEKVQGTLEFDATPPEVTLISPVAGAFAGPGSAFSFRASDNIAETLDCTVYLDDDEVESLAVDSGEDAEFNLDLDELDEGTHDWKVSCTDRVGLANIAQDEFSYDKTPPVITLNSPNDGAIIGSTDINITITDNFGVESESYSLPLDTSTWQEGKNTLTVTARDKAGNEAEKEFTFYVDRTPPTISVLSPADGSTVEYTADFTIRAEDDYDDEIDCTLETSTAGSFTDSVPTGTEASISAVLPLGNFTWYLVCEDDAGNSVTTSTYHATAIDTTGPVIELDDVRYVVRGRNLSVSAKITDVSGVDSAIAEFDGVSIALDKSGDDYTGIFATDPNATLGTYTYTVLSKDTNGFNSTETDEFELVEGYLIKLSIPGRVNPGAAVSLSGSVVRDDGAIPSGDVTIKYHETGVAELDSEGKFAHSFTAPNAEGTYTVRVEYETDKYIYVLEKTYRVGTQQQSGGSGGGGTSDGYGINVLPYQYTPPTVQQETQGGQNLEVQEESTGHEFVPEQSPPQIVEPELPQEEPRTPIGTGQATGVLSALGKIVKWWILLLALIALGVGLYMANRRLKKPKSDGKINWDGYFD